MWGGGVFIGKGEREELRVWICLTGSRTCWTSLLFREEREREGGREWVREIQKRSAFEAVEGCGPRERDWHVSGKGEKAAHTASCWWRAWSEPSCQVGLHCLQPLSVSPSLLNPFVWGPIHFRLTPLFITTPVFGTVRFSVVTELIVFFKITIDICIMIYNDRCQRLIMRSDKQQDKRKSLSPYKAMYR